MLITFLHNQLGSRSRWLDILSQVWKVDVLPEALGSLYGLFLIELLGERVEIRKRVSKGAGPKLQES